MVEHMFIAVGQINRSEIFLLLFLLIQGPAGCVGTRKICLVFIGKFITGISLDTWKNRIVQ